jgi:uncharacterized protein with HEPN domain
MQAPDRIRLQHMLEAANLAVSFCAGKSRSDLDRDPMLVMALVKAVEIVGEAAAKVSEETRRLLPEVPWQAIVDMRHRLVHAYYDINLTILWLTVEEDLPPLLQQLQSTLPPPENDAPSHT